MANTPFVMPKLAMGMNEGTVQEWMVEDGDFVEKGQTFATVETEKVAYELEAPQAGYFKRLVAVETTVPIETPIGVFADSEAELSDVSVTAAASPAQPQEAAAADQPQSTQQGSAVTPAGGGRIIASPLARKMAQQRGLELAGIQGSGPGGRIVKRDILSAGTQSRPVATSAALQEQARLPVSNLRRTIAEAMMEQTRGTATLTQYSEADITDLLATRKRLVAQEELLGGKISVNSFLIKAIAWAARQVPIVNSTLQGDEIVIWDNVNVGVALALPSGDGYTENLMVPVIKNVDQSSLMAIDQELKRLIGLGREGKLGVDDMADSTITFSTTAGIAPDGTSGNSILNGSNTCLVGIGGAKLKPAEHQGEIALRQIAPVCVNYDHRVIDGAPASRFMRYLHSALQDPGLLLV